MPEDNTELFKRRYVVAENGCWIWQASLNSDGYGKAWYKGKLRLAHRLSYLLHIGDIPEGLEIDHLYRNRNCVNPEHLEAVPHKVNVNRGEGSPRQSHCKRGHLLEGDNVAVYGKQRYCRICLRDRTNAWHREHKLYRAIYTQLRKAKKYDA